MAIKLLIGGSPCTFWSIAQKNNRETTAEGLGWELFKNYLIAKEKFKPDYFLYENNKSAAQAIKDQIKKELNVWDGSLLMEDTGVRYIEINSALVSAQNRQRFYVHNCGDVEQPEDRGILLKDILGSGESLSNNKKSYCLTASYNGACAWNTLERCQREMVAEPVIFNTPHGYNNGGIKYDKAPTLTALGSYQHNNHIIEPIRVGSLPRPNGELSTSQAMRVYSVNGKSVCQSAGGDGMGGKTGLYAIPTDKPIYEVKDGFITIKGKQYPIKLPDGYYIIRKLTVTECCRLQGMPDWWFLDKNGNKLVSNAQAYKGLGNGWQLDTVKYILNNALSKIPKNTQILLLSMYDGIGTGRRILEELGFKNVKYYAYEIDKYCIALTKYRYPDVIHKGDAFKVRNQGEIESII